MIHKGVKKQVSKIKESIKRGTVKEDIKEQFMRGRAERHRTSQARKARATNLIRGKKK